MFSNSMKQLSESLDGLREFTALSASYLSQKQDEDIKQNAKALVPLLAALQEISHAEGNLLDATLTDEFSTQPFNFDIELDSNPPADNFGCHIYFHDSASAEAFRYAMSKVHRSFNRIKHLYDASLVSIISNTEWYLSSLLHEYFDKYPDAIEGKEKTFSLHDLKSFETIEHARIYLVDHAVENILRGGFEDWLHFVKSKLNLSCGYLEDDIASLIEAFQRRNLLIHNGGIVNNIYLAKISPKLKEKYKLGERIPVEPIYLEDTISLFERCFLLIGAELWKKINPEDRERSNTLIAIAYEHLVAERWGIAEGLSLFTMNDVKLAELDRLIATVNYWQSLKWQGRFNEIQDLVQTMDFSAKHEVFPLAQAVLLDDFDAFFASLSHALDSNALPKGAFTNWPLFREVRKLDRARPFLDRDATPSQEELPSIRDQDCF